MKEFNKAGVSADHIGPISLGFCHSPFFAPMTKEENSAKNNRLRYQDVLKLIQLESEEIKSFLGTLSLFGIAGSLKFLMIKML